MASAGTRAWGDAWSSDRACIVHRLVAASTGPAFSQPPTGVRGLVLSRTTPSMQPSTRSCENVTSDLADRLLAPFSWFDTEVLKNTVEAAGFQMAADIGRRQFVSAFGGAAPSAVLAAGRNAVGVDISPTLENQRQNCAPRSQRDHACRKTGKCITESTTIDFRPWRRNWFDARSPSSLRLAARRQCRPKGRRLSFRSSL